jgi:hypothetical protein
MSEQDPGVLPGRDGSGLPDASGSTAQFRAFASRMSSEGEAPWTMRAPGRKVALLAGTVVVVAVVLAIIALAIANG